MTVKKSKKLKKKSFFFEDYKESEIIVNSIKSNLTKISLNRTAFLFFIFISLIGIFSLKIIYLSLSQEKNYYLLNEKFDFKKERGDIIDRNGVLIARNIDIYDAAVTPKLVKDKKKLLINLKLSIPRIDIDNIKRNLNKNKYFYIKRRLTEEEYTKLWLLGDKAIDFPKRQNRIYPQKNLFSHIIGQIDDKNNGISGVEKFFDSNLKKNLINSSLNLTLDSNLQYLIREELIKAQVHFNNIGSAAVLMDVENGEILSLVSLPDYDLNKRASIDEDIFTNKITKGVYELGSVFKTFTVAAALENNLINTDTIFEELENQIFCSGRKISEHDKLPKNLTVEQILIRSSNIGAVRIAQRIGIEKYSNFLNSLELFKKIDFEIEEVGTPLPFRWGKCKLATASFGHGITTTPLQLAKAYAILGNGGYKIEPTILKKKIKKKISKKYILKQTKKKII